MTQEQILGLETKKHVKIYKLHELGKSNKEISDLLETNAGHVYNALKGYKDDERKVTAANEITA